VGHRTALVLGVALLLAPASAPNAAHLRVVITPQVVAPYDWATVNIAGAPEATAVQVRLVGASDATGRLSPWIELRRHGDHWTIRLPQPAFAGIYPIEVRTQPNRVTASRAPTYLRDYWPGTETSPLFSTPEQVAEAWVRDKAGGTLDAIRPWPGNTIDHRLPPLHRLFVVAYSLPSRPSTSDRLGAWITAVREGFHGRWHLLEASVTPP